MYDTLLSSVLWYISWPLLILFSWLMVRAGLRVFEKRQAGKSQE